MNLTQFIYNITPPILWNIVRRIRSRISFKEFEYIPEGWEIAEKGRPEIKGWNVPDVCRINRNTHIEYLKHIDNPLPFGISEVDSLSDINDICLHNNIMTFAYALALAARHVNSVSLLDWGGSLGHYYLAARALLPHLQIEYHCKDMPVFSDSFSQLLPEAHFYSDDTCLERKYDFVFACNSLHYSREWRAVLEKLVTATNKWLLLSNVFIVHKASSFVFLQRPYRYGYNTAYLGWCFNRIDFLDELSSNGLKLYREFIIGYHPFIHGAPEQNEYRAFLFHKSVK